MIKNIIKKIQSNNLSLHESNLRFYILNGVLLTIVTNLYKPFAQKFIFRLNGTESHISLYNALPGLVAFLVLIPGTVFICNSINIKRIIAWTFFSSRLIILSFALVPFAPTEFQPLLYVLLSSLMNFPESISTTAVQSYSADVFNERERANAIAMRNKYSNFFGFIILLVLGQIIKWFGSTDANIIKLYQLFFVAAFLFGLIEIGFFLKIREEHTPVRNKIDIRKVLPEILKNKRYMIFLGCSLLFHFGWQMGWPLFSIYQIKYLGADETWLTISNVTSGMAMFFSFSRWEKIIHTKGNAFAIAFATFGMAATPILFAISPNLYVLTVAGLITGFFTSGTITVILNSLLEVSPTKNRMVYVAFHATMTNLTLAIAPFVGDFALGRFNIYIALCICAAVRFVGSFAFFIRSRRISHITQFKE